VDFTAKFLTGKVPTFESKSGHRLFESNGIAFYVANEQLRGKSSDDTAAVLQWFEFADQEILPAACAWTYPCKGVMQLNKQNVDRAREDVARTLGVLNTHLLTHTYLVGERITLADISVACTLLDLYQLVLEPEFRKPYQNVNRWFVTLVNQPQFKAVLGEVKLCDKMAQFDGKKFAEVQKAAGGGKKPEKAAEEKPKKQEKPAQEKPKKEEKPAVPEADAEDDDAHEKPTKDPFSDYLATKSSFVMDDWKKVYSNNDTKTVALPYFWEKFDKDNYSVWMCEYKYPEELRLTFMSSNLIGGFFQRLDKMRKHAFGSMIVFGEDNKSTISGLWFWRGPRLAFELSDDLKTDYESYTWTKLDDITTDDAKKKINEYLTWEGNFDGKKYNQGKIFK